MNRTSIMRGLACCVAVVGLSIGIATAASAGTVTGYYDEFYKKGIGVRAETWYNANANFNDEMGSFTHSGSSTYYEDIKYRGNTIIIEDNCDDLGHHKHPFGNWNNRISSFR